MTVEQLNKLLKELSLRELKDHAIEMIKRLGENAVNGNVTSIRMLRDMAEKTHELEQMTPEDCHSLLERQISLGMQTENEQEKDAQ